MIKWQGPGVLYHKGRKFKAGSEIPAGILTPDRLAEFVHAGKIKVEGEFKPKAELKTPAQIKAEAEAKKKADKEAERIAKEKEDAENEELARMQAEEDERIAAELALSGQA